MCATWVRPATSRRVPPAQGDQLQALEERLEFLARAPPSGAETFLFQRALGLSGQVVQLLVFLARVEEMADHHVGAGGQAADVLAHESGGIAVVVDVMQCGALHQQQRLIEVEISVDRGILEYPSRLGEVEVEEMGALVRLQ